MSERYFTRMDEGNAAQWAAITRATVDYQATMPQTILRMLESLRGVHAGFGVDQLHHSLQCATMAKRDGASDEIVLCALVHDVGKYISIPNHAAIAAEMIKPYVSQAAYSIIRAHQDFQGSHYYAYIGLDPTVKESSRNEPWFAQAEQFANDWDQAAFDPRYPVLGLSEFAPLVRQFFGTSPYAALLKD